MNKVMAKLFQSEKKVSVSDTHQSRTCALPNHPHHELPIATAAEEDNLVINIVSGNQDEDKLSELQVYGLFSLKFTPLCMLSFCSLSTAF